jgi:uncharacterized membrane protein
MQNPPPNQQGYGYGSPYETPPPNAPLATPPGGGPKDKTSMGLDANVAALLAYVATWLSGLIIFLMEKENRFVRFHAMQAIMFGVSIIVLYIVAAIVSLIFGLILSMIHESLAILAGIIWLIVPVIALVGWVMCLIKAYQGQWFKLPIIGNMAEKMVNK